MEIHQDFLGDFMGNRLSCHQTWLAGKENELAKKVYSWQAMFDDAGGWHRSEDLADRFGVVVV